MGIGERPNIAREDLELIHAVAPNIRDTLKDSAFDVERAFRQAEIKLLRDCTERPDGTFAHEAALIGFKAILGAEVAGAPIVIAISDRLNYVYQAYADDLDMVRRHRPELTDLELISALRRPAAAALQKMAGGNHTMFHGRRLVPRPYMGRYIELEPETSVELHWRVVDEAFKRALTPEVDAVLEIGCGAGHALAKLALTSGRQGVQFFGGEIARNGRTCLEMLRGRATNIHAIEFDLENPDLGFLAPFARVLVISHTAIVYGKGGGRLLWDRLFATVPQTTAVLFELLSFAIPGVEKPLFPRHRAEAYGYDLEVYPALAELAAAGRIQMVEVVPDISGFTGHSATSLIRFKTL